MHLLLPLGDRRPRPAYRPSAAARYRSPRLPVELYPCVHLSTTRPLAIVHSFYHNVVTHSVAALDTRCE